MDKTEEKEFWVPFAIIIAVGAIITLGINYLFWETIWKFASEHREWMIFGVVCLFMGMKILESGDKMDALVSLLPFFILLGCLLFVLHIISLQATAGAQKSEQEYQQYGCYPITREYQECSPVEGKLGFTKCTTKTERVCPKIK